MNAGNKNTFSKHHPRRRNATTSMVGKKNKTVTFAKIKNLTQNGEPWRYSWKRRRTRGHHSSAFPAISLGVTNLLLSQLYLWGLPIFYFPSYISGGYQSSTFPAISLGVTSYSRFFTISSQRRELSPTRTLKWPRRNQITYNTSSAYHVQHVALRATWYEGTAQLLSLTELKSHLFELYFVC